MTKKADDENKDEYAFYKRLAFIVSIVIGVLTAAGFVYAKADESDVDALELRIRQIEQNDIKQTTILERIERKLDNLK